MHRFKKTGNKYTLSKCFIDLHCREKKTLYKQLKPEEYSEGRKQAMLEIEKEKERYINKGINY